MKHFYPLFYLLLLSNLIVSAQKVDLDREYFKVEYIKLPTNPIPESEKRTFSFMSNIPKANEEVKLHGFERIDTDGNVDVSVYFEDIYPNEIEIKKEKHEEKNKEGKVTRTWYTYEAILTYRTKGQVIYQSIMDPKRNYSIGGHKKHTKTFRSNKAASEYAKNNLSIFARKFHREFIDEEIESLNKFLNRKYGYEDWWHKELFWILDSESNPEYSGHKAALQDIKAIFDKIKINSDVKALIPEVEKIETYFNSVIPKFPKDKRKHRKMRYASYYNIAKLYFTIENFEKAEEYAQKIIDNRYDKSDGKKLLKKINHLKELFKINKTNTRHLKITTVDNRKPISNTEVVVIEKEPVMEEKPITELTLTGRLEIDNKIRENLLDELELIHFANEREINPFKGRYLKKNGATYGKELHKTIGNRRYDTITLISFDNKVLGTKFSETESSFEINENNLLKKLKNKYIGSSKVSRTSVIKRNDKSQIVEVKNYTEEDFSRILDTYKYTYHNDKLKSILIDMHRRKDDKILVDINENTNKKLLSTVKYFNKKIETDDISYEFILEDPLNMIYNFKISYKEHVKNKPVTIKHFYTYTDFGQVIQHKKYSTSYKKKTNKEYKSEFIETNKFEGINLTQSIKTTNNISKPELSFKFIYNYVDLRPENDNPEYEWKKGTYEFNYKDELIFISREGKHKKKENGVWSDWRWNRM